MNETANIITSQQQRTTQNNTEPTRRMIMGDSAFFSDPKKSRLYMLTLFALVIVLSSYVFLDILLNHAGGGSTELRALDSFASPYCATFNSVSPTCRTMEDYAEEEETDTKDNPWRQMKWIGRPARCKVKGMAIERLDDAHNFRRGFALRYASDVEDKTHILPWLLAVRKPELSRSPRRVFLDLGANAVTTSITWFLRMYPLDFTEIHAFEADPTLLRLPQKGFDEDSNIAMPNPASLAVKATPGIPQWMLDRIRVYQKYVSDRDDPSSNSVNITRFIKDELKLTPEDTVIVKMDIEGAEWPILARWIADPAMALIVDELFVEIHYNHPSMWNYHWSRYGSISRSDAKKLLADLRWHGFFAHFWP